MKCSLCGEPDMILYSCADLVDTKKDIYALDFCEKCTSFLLREHKNTPITAKIKKVQHYWLLDYDEARYVVIQDDDNEGFLSLKQVIEHCNKNNITWRLEES